MVTDACGKSSKRVYPQMVLAAMLNSICAPSACANVEHRMYSEIKVWVRSTYSDIRILPTAFWKFVGCVLNKKINNMLTYRKDKAKDGNYVRVGTKLPCTQRVVVGSYDSLTMHAPYNFLLYWDFGIVRYVLVDILHYMFCLMPLQW